MSDNVSVSLSACTVDRNIRVHTSITPEEGTKRTPVDVCCVVDISGSMSTTATFQNEKGETESHGLTILDIVKHAVNTIIQTLEENDRLSIVTYSTSASVVTNLLYMNEEGKKKSSEELKLLYPQASTNLWDGLLKGMEVLKAAQKDNRFGSIFILTDGMPNVDPPGGHIPMLKKYKDTNNLECTISSFGFGYSMDSPLLKDIAKEGDGMYAFIPDSGFVGTTFVNALSNLLVTKSKNVILNIEPADGYKVKQIDDTQGDVTSWGLRVPLGTIQFGQSRDFVFELEKISDTTSDEFVSVTVNFDSACGTKKCTCESKLTSISDAATLELEQSYLRQTLVHTIKQISSDLSKSKKIVDNFVQLAKSCCFVDDDFIDGMIVDAEGQISEAVSKDEYYNKWGKHYLPSLARAHALQQCNNFKDPGIQFYGGDLFNEIRDIGDDIFISLPPPEPTGSSYSYGGYSSSSFASNTYTAPSSMSAYYCSSNPCFSGDSLVSMWNGTLKRCDEIKKGDLISVGDKHSFAKVICVVQTNCANGKADLVTLDGGLKVTEYHPVRFDGKWYFPSDIKQAKNMECSHVFSYVLDSHHTMIINGVECVTLGHSFTEETVAHPYFGSDLVIKDLKRMHGWESGKVIFAPGCMLKNPNTDLVCAFDISRVVVTPLNTIC